LNHPHLRHPPLAMRRECIKSMGVIHFAQSVEEQQARLNDRVL
jgi:hypothetical protein